MLLMGKSTISMAIFNCYVSSPGRVTWSNHLGTSSVHRQDSPREPPATACDSWPCPYRTTPGASPGSAAWEKNHGDGGKKNMGTRWGSMIGDFFSDWEWGRTSTTGFQSKIASK